MLIITNCEENASIENIGKDAIQTSIVQVDRRFGVCLLEIPCTGKYHGVDN